VAVAVYVMFEPVAISVTFIRLTRFFQSVGKVKYFCNFLLVVIHSILFLVV